MTHPGPEPAILDTVAREWLRAIAGAGFVPGPRAAAFRALRDLLRQVVAIVRAEPFEPEPGRRIGVGLVELRMTAPPVLGTSVRLLTERLPALLGQHHPAVRDRVPLVLEHLTHGFVAASRDTTQIAAEQLNRSLMVAWHADQERMRASLEHARLHDVVTGLPNRACLREQLRTAIASAGPRGRLGVCLLRADDFTDLNDALGHERGDELLTVIGTQLRRVVAALPGATSTPWGMSARYFLAHLGGEQFIIMAADTRGPDQMVKVADEARRALITAPLPTIDGYRLRPRVTAGIVEAAAAGTRPDDWLRDAHLALGWAGDEHQGRAVHDPGRAGADLERHRLAAAMPAALDRGEITSHYQTLHTLSDRRIVGVEALARWLRRTGPAPGPQVFIGLAEQTGLISRLGRDLLEQACRHSAGWRARGHALTVSVNLSPRQLGDPSLIGGILNVLDRTGLPASALQLEITESAEVDHHSDILHRLTACGIRLAIDDFGTGYSSLASLSRLPLTTAKLARELVAGLDDPADRHAAAVVERTIQLCHDLDITVLAEGIETRTQYQRLRDLGCHQGQGFLFSRPTTADGITALL
jgi:diguanylate cyclase (GGDEF)-like protein